MQRRAMSCTGPTLFPLDRNSVRVLTVAVFETPSIRPLRYSDVNVVHKLLCPCPAIDSVGESQLTDGINYF